MGSYPKRKAGFDWEMCKDVADIPETPYRFSIIDNLYGVYS